MQEVSRSIVEPQVPCRDEVDSLKIGRPIPFCWQITACKGICLFFFAGEGLAKDLHFVKTYSRRLQNQARFPRLHVRDIREIKITVRDAEVLKLLVQGCSNKEIASQLKISPRTVKQHLRTMFLRAGIRDGRKRVKLATAMFQKEQTDSCNRVNS